MPDFKFEIMVFEKWKRGRAYLVKSIFLDQKVVAEGFGLHSKNDGVAFRACEIGAILYERSCDR